MSRLLCIAVASVLSVATQAVLAQEGHERPEAEPGTLKAVRVEVEAGKLYSPSDLASSGLSAEDLIPVSSFASSGKIDPSSRNDH